jgi:hypothetical protein
MLKNSTRLVKQFDTAADTTREGRSEDCRKLQRGEMKASEKEGNDERIA